MKYYCIAGERSGDLHGSNLIKAIKRHDRQAVFHGFGGDEMKLAGMELTVHYDAMSFMGFVALITNLFIIFQYIARCKKDILAYQPDVIILIDYGGFNRRIAKWAKGRGLKVFYYITPKVWAWYQKRAIELKRNVDRMFVILPFEKNFFKKFGWEVDYVGNPVLDAIKSFQHNPQFRVQEKLTSSNIVALLPGSRKMELQRMVPLMAQVAVRFPQYQFVVAAVSNLPQVLYAPLTSLPNVKLVFDSSYDLLSVSRAAIVTSGTATLETGIFKVPQVVVYRMGALEYQVVKRLVKVRFISLVNLIADREVVKELIQEKAQLEIVVEELSQLMEDEAYREKMLSEYQRIYTILDTGSASENAARLMVGYLK